jgi:tRNA (guanine-N7-)-methyltransferase
MGQKKLVRFAELKTFSNVLQYPENMAGNWDQFFNNKASIILELACGKGEYAVGLAQLHPNKNFIGIDLKGNRIWVGAKKALQQNLNNVAFLRIQIDRINEFFGKDEVEGNLDYFSRSAVTYFKIKKAVNSP